MMTNPVAPRYLLFLLLWTALPPLSAAQTGEAVRLVGNLADDTYAAGGTVDVLATVDGDVVVAGGRVTVAETVTGDVMAAGGLVSVRAEIGDDARVAGGDVTLSGAVAGDVMAAAGNLTLVPEARVGGRAWLSGGRIDIAGTVGRQLKAAGGRIVLSGHVHGDVKLAGGTISILDSAIIDGDLDYRSPQQAEIASGAQIRGTINYEPIEEPVTAVISAAAGVGIVVLLSLIVTGIALFLMFPRFIADAAKTIRSEPWKCLGLGLAMFATAPVVISVLFMTMIGWLPAIIISALYPVLLLTGFLTGVFYFGTFGRRYRQRGDMSRARWLWSFVIALLVLILLGLVPLLGQLLLFVVMLLGVGVLTLTMYRGAAERSAV